MIIKSYVIKKIKDLVSLENYLLLIQDKLIKRRFNVEIREENQGEQSIVFLNFKNCVNIHFYKEEFVIELEYEKEEGVESKDVDNIVFIYSEQNYFEKPEIKTVEKGGATTIHVYFTREKDFEFASKLFIYRTHPLWRGANCFKKKTIGVDNFSKDFQEFLKKNPPKKK